MTAVRRAGDLLFRLSPQYRERVWGGRRLRDVEPPIGELWAAFGDSRVDDGPAAGRTVAALVADDPAGMLGEDVAARYGTRFPLLIKLLDTADWLSVQVHPNDAQAERLVGPGEWGKTEAWHIVESAPGARGRVGVGPGTTPVDLAAAIRAGRVHDLMRDLPFRVGETVLVPAGTLHTIGPGVLLYEVQQASDATFRAYDWGRPTGIDRPLHVEESVAVADPAAAPVIAPPPALVGTSATAVAACRHFRLDALQVEVAPLVADTNGRSFHVLTAIEGSAEVTWADRVVRIERFDTALVAGGAGSYSVAAIEAPARVMRASVPV